MNTPAAQQALTTSGFAFVTLPPGIQTLAQNAKSKAAEFFNEELKHKAQYFRPPVFGFLHVPHKESLRILTGNHLSPADYPPACAEQLKQLAEIMDKEMKTLATELFGDLSALNANFPLFGGVSEYVESSRPHFALLDIAHYFNIDSMQSGPLANDLNCEAHTDPGLISLNVCNSSSGLQFWDPQTDSWVDCPTDPSMGVLWCGDAAVDISNGKMKAGKHRVVRGNDSRISIWHEICTAEQVPAAVALHGINAEHNNDAPKIVSPFHWTVADEQDQDRANSNRRNKKTWSLAGEKRTGVPRTKKGKGGKNRKPKAVEPSGWNLADEKKTGVPKTKRKVLRRPPLPPTQQSDSDGGSEIDLAGI
eukprot:TRINITY_DN67242_c3_g7_i1.p2 TRINITY_DN67242_c3_g7~~TRINITY_DN67242_c3_g7_i1.p2  ORF type:complete len:383 (+),score=39.52 TRINITY_DN67242_c3_g7_i1:63-1151(+)